MKIVACALLGMASLLVGPSVAADVPRFSTTWKFEARFGDGIQTYNENLNIVVNVWIPQEMKWECQRVSPALIEGRKRASFGCSSDGWKTRVLTMVGCKADEVDPPRTAAMRIWGPRPPDSADAGAAPMGKFVDLTVTCETVKTP